MKSHKITKVINIPPPEAVNICAKFHGNPSNSCGDISVGTKGASQQSDAAIP